MFAPQAAWAGLYYSGETYADLPAQWRGFLLDQRMLRNITADVDPPSPIRVRYLDEAAKFEKIAKDRALTAEELADAGAIVAKVFPQLTEAELREEVAAMRAGHEEHLKFSPKMLLTPARPALIGVALVMFQQLTCFPLGFGA